MLGWLAPLTNNYKLHKGGRPEEFSGQWFFRDDRKHAIANCASSDTVLGWWYDHREWKGRSKEAQRTWGTRVGALLCFLAAVRYEEVGDMAICVCEKITTR